MATIDELMKGKKPGEIKVSSGEYLGDDNGFYFIPFFKIDYVWHGQVIGPEHIRADYFKGHENDTWYLYTEPKKKVKRWMWAYQSSTNRHNWFVDSIYYTEDEFKSRMGKKYNYKKLCYSEMEFED